MYKRQDYTAIEAYLVYQHDAFTGKQLLDEQGRPKLRESYILDTLECDDFSFATACLLANRKYGKNTQHGDIKSHQYIISFDPRDAACLLYTSVLTGLAKFFELLNANSGGLTFLITVVYAVSYTHLAGVQGSVCLRSHWRIGAFYRLRRS